MTTAEALARNLCRLQADRGISVQHLASATDIGINTIGRLRLARGNPRLSTIEALAHHLATTPADLLRPTP